MSESSDGGPGGFSTSIAENRITDDWLVYVALVPCIAIATATAMYVATAAAWHNRLVPNAPGVNQASIELDDYVEQLAKIGIAQLRGNDPPITGIGPRGGSWPLIQAAQSCIT
jgi:hypothetical protein